MTTDLGWRRQAASPAQEDEPGTGPASASPRRAVVRQPGGSGSKGGERGRLLPVCEDPSCAAPVPGPYDTPRMKGS